jgi:hypothetical protein
MKLIIGAICMEKYLHHFLMLDIYRLKPKGFSIDFFLSLNAPFLFSWCVSAVKRSTSQRAEKEREKSQNKLTI